MMRRSKPRPLPQADQCAQPAARERVGTPAETTGGQSARVPSIVAPEPHKGDDPQVDISVPPDASLSYYKGVPLASIGRDPKTGKTIPHTYVRGVAERIKIWVAGGADVNAICIRLNMRPGLLKKLYSNELATGLDSVGMDLTESIYKRAKKSDRLAIFFAKARLGWRDGDGPVKDTNLLNINIHL